MSKESKPVVLRTFTAGQAVKASGLSYAQIDRLAKSGVVEPSVKVASGPESCRVYGFQDLVALRVAAKLRSAGISARELRKVVNYLKSLNYANSLAGPYLLIPHNGDVCCMVERSKLVSMLKNPGQLYLVFDLDDAVKELKSMAQTFAKPDRGKAKIAVA